MPEPSSPPESELPSGLAAAIPELFYNLIADILPGLLLIAAVANSCYRFTAWLRGNPQHWLSGDNNSVATGGLTLLFAWALGLLVRPFEKWVGGDTRKKEAFSGAVHSYWWLFAAAEKNNIIMLHTEAPLDWQKPEAELLESYGQVYRQVHEYLKDRNRAWREVLAKSQAEGTFYSNTFSAMIVALVVIAGLGTVSAFMPGTNHCWGNIGRVALLSMTPPIMVMIVAYAGISGKFQKVWDRHIALLVTDSAKWNIKPVRGG